MIQNYRNSFLRLAISYVYSNQNDKALATLDQMERQVPRKIRGMDFGLEFELSNIYLNAGGMNQYKEIAAELEKKHSKSLMIMFRIPKPITILTECLSKFIRT